MVGDSSCRARDDEIAEILKPISSRAGRSVTLLYGDSGIGKSTLLREVERQLSKEDGVTSGIYECPVGDVDPLVRALDRLLQQIYTLAGSLDQIAIACQNLKTQVSLSGLKDFLLLILESSGEVAGLGPLAKVATKAFGWITDKATNLDLRVPAGSLPKLGITVFRDVLKILQTALPDRKLVFILDNLNAPFESFAAEERGSSAIDTLQTFLSQDFGQAHRVHFVLSWKLTPKTQKTFDDLGATLEEYGGRLIELRPMTPQGISAWMADEFPWFVGLDEAERKRVVALSGGLPQIVAGWRESGVESGLPEELQEVADSVRTGKYRYLSRALQQAPTRERELILAVCLVNRPLGVTELMDLLQRSGVDEVQTCFDELRSWVGKHLLRQESGPVVRFRPEHDKKREVALDSLSQALADGGRSVHIRTYDFLLNRVEVPTLDDPNFAELIEVAARSPYLDTQRFALVRLESLDKAAYAGQTLVLGGGETWQLPAGWPRHLQARFLAGSLQTGFGDPFRISTELLNWLEAFRSPPEDIRKARALAESLDRLAQLARQLMQHEILQKLIWQLHDVQAAYSSDVQIARSLAKTAETVVRTACELKEPDKAEQVLRLSLRLARTFPEDYWIAKSLADGAVSTVSSWAEPGQFEKAEKLLPLLRQLAERFPDDEVVDPLPSTESDQLSISVHFSFGVDSTIPRKLAKALASCAHFSAQKGRMDTFASCVTELGKMQRLTPTDLGIAVWYSRALYTGFHTYLSLNQPAGVEAMLNYAYEVAATFKWSYPIRRGIFQIFEQAAAVHQPVTPGLSFMEKLSAEVKGIGQQGEREILKTILELATIAIATHAGAGDWAKFELDLKHLRALRISLPEQSALSRLLAGSLSTGIENCLNYKEAPLAVVLFDELAELIDVARRDEFVAECLTKSAALVIIECGAGQPPEKLDFWVAGVRELANTHLEQVSVAAWAAKALANAASIYNR